jgi:hypothetical protein
MQSGDTDYTLNELLDKNAGFDLAARGTTNHCPMALVALARMGASPLRLREFFDMWERKYALPAPRVDTTIERSEWLRHLGNTAAFGALRLCFVDWIADDGPETVIVNVLTQAPFAPATGAFHAIIRMSYGIEAAHHGEIASGLAALVASHLPISVNFDERRTAESVESAFVGVARAVESDAVQGSSITARLRAVASHAGFARAMLAPPATSSLLDDVARATIAAYWRTRDFTVLHTVTATHAARILFAQLPDALIERLMPSLWVALCAAYATVRKPLDVEADTPDVDTDWREVCEMAVLADDDHVIKMTYTCLCESRRQPSPLYLAAASRLVGIDRVRS